MKGKWIDISQPLHNGIAEWPGDTPFTYEVEFTKADTGSVNIGKLTTSTHMGTHIDAPFHFDDTGKRVLDLPIDLYIGRARVINLTGAERSGVRNWKVRFRWGGTYFIENRKSSGINMFPEKFTCCVRISVLY